LLPRGKNGSSDIGRKAGRHAAKNIEAADTARYARLVVDRILWNRRSDDPDIDEIVIENATVHIEQMSDRCWWIGIYRGDDYWMGNFTADSRGRMRFTEQENHGIEWEMDQSNDMPVDRPRRRR
jgi:hypothetical protein